MINAWKYLTFDNIVSSTQIGIVRNTKEQSVDFPVRYFKMNNIKNNNGIDGSKYTSINATADEIQKYSLKNGDFLFNTRNSYELVGKTCVFKSSDNEPIVFNNNILRARFKDFVSSDFVAYAFCAKKVKINLNKLKRGTTSVVGIYYKSLKDLKIPVPPLSEQKKIVETLDKAFEKIDKAIANIERNIENAEELFQSKLNNEVVNFFGKTDQQKLRDVTTFIDYRGRTPKKSEKGVKLITAKNVRMGYIKDDPKEFIAETDYVSWMTRGFPKAGDVLFTTEAPLANVALLKSNEKIALAQRIITIQPKQNVLNGEYLSYCLQSTKLQQEILGFGTGATVVGIKSKLLKEIKIPIPSLDDQNDFFLLIDEFRTKTNITLRNYKIKKDNLIELKKSILEKAFKGELTSAA